MLNRSALLSFLLALVVASAILICNEHGLKKLGLKPRARIVALSVAGDDPVMMLSGRKSFSLNIFFNALFSTHPCDQEGPCPCWPFDQ